MSIIDIPSWIDESSRKSIISYIANKSSKETPLKVFRGLVLDEDESFVKSLVSHSPNLTEVQLRRGATNEILEILGHHCPNLIELNMYSRVSSDFKT